MLRQQAEEDTMEQTVLDNLVIDNREDGLFRAHRSAFTAPHLLEVEQRRVRTVLDLCRHASEIPQPGIFGLGAFAARLSWYAAAMAWCVSC
jgi:hypothetical protein